MRLFLLITGVLLLAVSYGTYFYIPKTPSGDVVDRLRVENKALEAELLRFKNGIRDFSCSSFDSVAASVFSTYPWSVRNEITLNAGDDAGIREGRGVLEGCAVFVGTISQVFPKSSTAITIYDSRLEIPVFVGENRVSGLLRGGPQPIIDLLEKEVSFDDVVVIADKRFPYGLVAGKIGTIRSGSGGSVLKKADLVPSFSASELRDVRVIR